MTPRRPSKQGVYCLWGVRVRRGWLVGRTPEWHAVHICPDASHWQTRSVHARPATRLLACLHGSWPHSRGSHCSSRTRLGRSERHGSGIDRGTPRLSTGTSQGSTPPDTRPTSSRPASPFPLSRIRIRPHGSRPLGRPCTQLARMPQRFVHEGRAGAALGQTLIAEPTFATHTWPDTHAALTVSGDAVSLGQGGGRGTRCPARESSIPHLRVRVFSNLAGSFW